jgi:hypothetical protein
LVPRDERRSWVRGWLGELAWIEQRTEAAAPVSASWAVTRFALGAWPHGWAMATREWGVDRLGADVRAGLRALGRHPGSTALVVLVAAVALAGAGFAWHGYRLLDERTRGGTSTAVLAIDGHDSEGQEIGVSLNDVRELGRRHDVFAAVTVFDLASYNLTDPPEAVPAVLVPENFFRTLGVTFHLGGPWSRAEDDRPADVVVLGYSLWQRRFAGDPAIVGRTITLDGSTSYRIAGVLPPGVTFPDGVELYRALGSLRRADQRGLWAVGVPNPARPRESIQAALDASATPGVRFRIRPLEAPVVLPAPAFHAVLPTLAVLLTVSATATVALRLRARAVQAGAERNVRRALGGSAVRQIRPLVIEIAALGMATLLVAVVALLAVPRRGPGPGDSGLLESMMPWAVGFGLAILVLVAGAGRTAVRQRMPATGAAATILLGASVAAVVLALGLGWVVVDQLRARPAIGQVPVLTARVAPPWRKYDGRDAVSGVVHRMLAEMERQPGLAAASYPLPIRTADTRRARRAFRAPGQPRTSIVTRHVVAGPYFRVLGLPVLAGRVFDGRDTGESARVVVLGASSTGPAKAAEMIGAVVEVDGDPRRVVGVVDDRMLGEADAGHVFVPLAQQHSYWVYLLVRAAGTPPAHLEDRVRRAVRAIDADQGIGGVATIESLASGAVVRSQQAGTASLLCAGWVLLSSLLSLATALRLHAMARARELAVCVALGASPPALTLRLARPMMRGGAVGVSLGAIGGWRALSQLGSAPELPLWAVGAVALGVLVLAVAVARRVVGAGLTGNVARILDAR